MHKDINRSLCWKQMSSVSYRDFKSFNRFRFIRGVRCAFSTHEKVSFFSVRLKGKVGKSLQWKKLHAQGMCVHCISCPFARFRIISRENGLLVSGCLVRAKTVPKSFGIFSDSPFTKDSDAFPVAFGVVLRIRFASVKDIWFSRGGLLQKRHRVATWVRLSPNHQCRIAISGSNQGEFCLAAIQLNCCFELAVAAWVNPMAWWDVIADRGSPSEAVDSIHPSPRESEYE